MRGSGDYDRKKKIQSSVWRVVLLYCVSFWFWREIGSFFVVAGIFYYGFWQLRLEKKDTVISLAGCAVVLVFGSGGKLAFFCSGGKF